MLLLNIFPERSEVIKIYLTLFSEDGLGLLVEYNPVHKLKNPASLLLHALLSGIFSLLGFSTEACEAGKGRSLSSGHFV